MNTAAHTDPLPRAIAIRVFFCFASGYLLSYALRSVNAVIAPELVHQFGLSNAQLGALSSAYFLAFAALQLPLGVWLDRYGSRNTDAALLLIAAVGCLVFALAPDRHVLWVGRALIGAGVCGALMASLRVFRFWYVQERQQQLAAWMLVIGSLGALSATVPVQWAMTSIGWRGVFGLVALLLTCSSAAIFWLVPREPARPVQPLSSQWAGYLRVFRSAYFWRFAIAAVAFHSGFVAYQSLWMGPWFTQVLGLSSAQSAQALLVFNFVLMLGYLFLGWAAPRLANAGWSTLRTVAWGTALTLVAQLAIVFAHGAGAWLLWLCLALGVTTYTLVQTHVSLTFPSELTGRAFSAFNLMLFVGMFAIQWLFGVLVDALSAIPAIGEGPPAFRVALFLWVMVQLGAFAVMLGWRVQPANEADVTR